MISTPQVINILLNSEISESIFFSDYSEKSQEVKRLTKNKFYIKETKINEIQSDNPIEVAKQKAYEAWKLNNYNPAFVEDTSFFVSALNGFPGTYAASFMQTVDQKYLICKEAKRKKDLRATTLAIIAIYDGVEFHTWQGKSYGLISDEPRGSRGFGWDDIFMPSDKNKNIGKTFAEMESHEKDKYSMRGIVWRKLLKSSFSYNHPVYQIPEPYEEELKRVRLNELSRKAKHFAYRIESIEKSNKPKSNLTATNYTPITKEDNSFYRRYVSHANSPSLGVILTNIDMDRTENLKNNEPILWQKGPKRRTLALAQRAHFFDLNQNKKVHGILEKYEKGVIKIPYRANKRIMTVERALGISNYHLHPRHTPAISEIGYKKISNNKNISRREIIKYGLFNNIGKYPRKIIGLGAMPPTTGWRDTIVTSAIGHMLSFIPRNSIFAGNINRKIRLAVEAKSVIDSLDIPKNWQNRIKRNIGASLGLDNPKEEVKTAKALYKKAGIKLFRIYTIGSDKRVTDLARLLRDEFGDGIEIFVGQIADKKQAEALINPKISVDALVYGHGGGQQCTSAINGMAITTLEDIYEIVLDSSFNNTSIIIEGGVERSIGTALMIGIDCCLGNQKLVHGAIETGEIFVQTKKGRIAQPYPGSASPVTQIIESENVKLRNRRTDPSGRTYNAEGKPGFMYFERKANSMVFWINEYLTHAARTLADLGVRNIAELRKLLNEDKKEYLRMMSEKTQYLSDAFGNYN